MGRLREIARVDAIALGKAAQLAAMIATVAGLQFPVPAEPNAALPFAVELC